VDGIEWKRVPEPINVLGSRYALCIKDLRGVEERLQLAETRVALGHSRGRVGSDYIKGRVDKACLELVQDADIARPESEPIEIGLVAEMVDPYAVFLRG
jgi:hypothetical protein